MAAKYKTLLIMYRWHQDVKPENILIVSNKAEQVHEWHFKLADLGISHFKLNSSTPYSAASDTYGTRTYGYNPASLVGRSMLTKKLRCPGVLPSRSRKLLDKSEG